MKSTFTGTVLSGAVQLDERVGLADQCRVHVTIVPIDENRSRWSQALGALAKLKKANPIRTGGQRFSREQLHERG